MKPVPKPEIEHFKRFHLLDLMSARHLNYLREKSLVVEYHEGDMLFSPPRSPSMGYYLLEGEVDIQIGGSVHKTIVAGSSAAYHSIEDKLPDQAVAVAISECKVLQVSRILVEQYFSWSTTGVYKAIDISAVNESVGRQQTEWMKPLLNSSLAKNLAEDNAQTFFALFSEHRVREGEIILHKGESNQHFFILKSGKARMLRANNEERILQVGGFFGEESLIPDAASSIQIEMLSPGLIAKLEKVHFNEYIKKSLIRKVSTQQLLKVPAYHYQLLDVRFPAEFKTGHESGAINIPINKLVKRCEELDSGKMIFLTLESGARGELAAYILQRKGYRAFVLDVNEGPGQVKLQA